MFETSTLNQSPVESAKAGLFWLSKDYKIVEDKIEGENKFDMDDIKFLRVIQPVGGHYWFDRDRDIPRGRIELVRGELGIYLGEYFPRDLYDDIFKQLVKNFQLGRFENIIKPVFHYHWNVQNK